MSSSCASHSRHKRMLRHSWTPPTPTPQSLFALITMWNSAILALPWVQLAAAAVRWGQPGVMSTRQNLTWSAVLATTAPWMIYSGARARRYCLAPTGPILHFTLPNDSGWKSGCGSATPIPKHGFCYLSFTSGVVKSGDEPHENKQWSESVCRSQRWFLRRLPAISGF